MISLRSLIVGLRCRLFCLMQTEMDCLVLHRNSSFPLLCFLVPAYAKISGRSTLRPAIASILSFCRKPKIGPTVISGVHVFVVHKTRRPITTNNRPYHTVGQKPLPRNSPSSMTTFAERGESLFSCIFSIPNAALVFGCPLTGQKGIRRSFAPKQLARCWVVAKAKAQCFWSNHVASLQPLHHQNKGEISRVKVNA